MIVTASLFICFTLFCLLLEANFTIYNIFNVDVLLLFFFWFETSRWVQQTQKLRTGNQKALETLSLSLNM